MASSPLLVWFSLALLPKPPIPGPLGWRTTPLPGPSFSPVLPPFKVPVTLDGRLGTGGIVPLPPKAAPLLNSDPKAPGDRREGEAIVA